MQIFITCVISPHSDRLKSTNLTNSVHSWQWRTWEGLPYLTCSLLERWQHGFFTQQFSPRNPANLVTVLQPQAQVYRVKQVHGNKVFSSSEIAEQMVNPNGEELPQADGILTEQAEQAVWVCTADCTPVLIADEKTGQVAAVHAGWRGTAQKIVPQAIDRLVSQGSKLEDLRIAMGPAIAGEVYQVSTEVAAEVGGSIISQTNDKSAKILSALQEIPNAPILPDPEDGKVRLDVRRVNELQLEQMGIRGEQIAIAPYCTFQGVEHFFSYRRDKLKKVQWSGIVSV